MSAKNTRTCIGILLLLLFSRAFAAHAQNSEVDGAVLDSSGGAIAKASIEFRNRNTGIRRQTTTNSKGIYHIGEIDPGKYDAIVEASGFKTLTRENIGIHSGDKTQVNFTMEIGLKAHRAAMHRTGVVMNVAGIAENALDDRRFVAEIRFNAVKGMGLENWNL